MAVGRSHLAALLYLGPGQGRYEQQKEGHQQYPLQVVGGALHQLHPVLRDHHPPATAPQGLEVLQQAFRHQHEGGECLLFLLPECLPGPNLYQHLHEHHQTVVAGLLQADHLHPFPI